jgi:predicted kinase
LVVYGPLCSGKTTMLKVFSQQQEKAFKISVDNIKSLVSDYNSERDFDTVNEILFDAVRSAVSKGYSIVIEGNTVIQRSQATIESIAEEGGLKLLEVNIIAPIEILEARFLQRLENAKAIGKKMAITSVGEMKLLHDQFHLHKKSIGNEYDSSILSPEDIAAKILAIINE